mmetsp:Transcript_13389/g.22798  ORF Transcript_13389/g.22798 Transcript_13389/m.22798 type:complete len:80 (-) Transcript_13389:361-600(-)
MSRNTALHVASANGHLQVVKLLLSQEGRVALDLQNETLNTPLHYAALNGHKEIVKLLVDRKAKPDLRNEFDKNAFDEAL